MHKIWGNISIILHGKDRQNFYIISRHILVITFYINSQNFPRLKKHNIAEYIQ